MSAPVLFTAHHGVVFFALRPVPDWTAREVAREIRNEGLDAPIDSRAFAVWLEASEQLKLAIFTANNQRRMSAPTPPRAA